MLLPRAPVGRWQRLACGLCAAPAAVLRNKTSVLKIVPNEVCKCYVIYVSEQFCY